MRATPSFSQTWRLRSLLSTGCGSSGLLLAACLQSAAPVSRETMSLSAALPAPWLCSACWDDSSPTLPRVAKGRSTCHSPDWPPVIARLGTGVPNSPCCSLSLGPMPVRRSVRGRGQVLVLTYSSDGTVGPFLANPLWKSARCLGNPRRGDLRRSRLFRCRGLVGGRGRPGQSEVHHGVGTRRAVEHGDNAVDKAVDNLVGKARSVMPGSARTVGRDGLESQRSAGLLRGQVNECFT